MINNILSHMKIWNTFRWIIHLKLILFSIFDVSIIYHIQMVITTEISKYFLSRTWIDPFETLNIKIWQIFRNQS